VHRAGALRVARLVRPSAAVHHGELPYTYRNPASSPRRSPRRASRSTRPTSRSSPTRRSSSSTSRRAPVFVNQSTNQSNRVQHCLERQASWLAHVQTICPPSALVMCVGHATIHEAMRALLGRVPRPVANVNRCVTQSKSINRTQRRHRRRRQRLPVPEHHVRAEGHRRDGCVAGKRW